MAVNVGDPVEGNAARVNSAGGLFTSIESVQVDVPTKPSISSTVSTTKKTIATTGTQLVAARTGRKQILIQNLDAANTLNIRLGSGTVDVEDLAIAPGEKLWLQNIAYEGAIEAKAQNASIKVVAVEF